MRPISLLPCLVFLAIALHSETSRAFVPVPVGGHPGEVDLSLRVGFERGIIEPTEYDGSWQKARWNIYQVGAGYTYGKVGPLDDAYFRVDSTFYTSPAESNAPENLKNTGRDAPRVCLGRTIAPGICEFHPEDNGALITPQIGANLVHTADFSFGLYLQGTIPISVNLEKFALPRIDYIAGGTQLGVHITPWFGYTSRLYIGSGAFGKQNAAVASTNLFVLEAKRWLLPWKVGVALGPYFEGDLTQRFDERYDAAYTLGYPERKDRIRSMKFGVAVLPYFAITEHAALELGYVQKLFGYDATATQFWYAGARAAF